MDFEDQRHALARRIVRRSRQPRLDRAAVRCLGIDLAHLTHRLARKGGRVQPGQLPAAHEQVCGVDRVAAGVGDDAAARDAERTAGIGPVESAAGQGTGDLRHATAERHARHQFRAMVVIGRVDRLAVGRPLDVVDAAIEPAGQQARAGAIAVHDVEVGVLVAAVRVLKAEVGDQPPVGRHRGRLVGPVPLGQRAHRTARDVERVDFAVVRLALPIGRAHRRKIQRPAVRRPAERAAIVVIAEGQLARRTAVGRHDEDMVEGRLDITAAVSAVGDPVDHLERFGPFRTLGLGRRLAQLHAFAGNRHRVGDLAAVRRPADAVRAFGQAGDAGRLSTGHPAHEKLRCGAVGTGRDISETAAIGRPARRLVVAVRSNQRGMLPALHIDQPDRRAHAVGHDVARAADIGNLRPVRADLGIAGDFEVEQVGAGKHAARPIGRRCDSGCLGKRRNGSAEQEQRQERSDHVEEIPTRK